MTEPNRLFGAWPRQNGERKGVRFRSHWINNTCIAPWAEGYYGRQEGVKEKMSSITERLAASAFSKYLESKGWTKVAVLPTGLYQADLSAISKIGVQVPAVVEKLVTAYMTVDLSRVYVEVRGGGIWTKKTGEAIADIPGAVVDAGKAEEVGAQVKRELTWVIVGVGAAVVGLVGLIVWRFKK